MDKFAVVAVRENTKHERRGHQSGRLVTAEFLEIFPVVNIETCLMLITECLSIDIAHSRYNTSRLQRLWHPLILCSTLGNNAMEK